MHACMHARAGVYAPVHMCLPTHPNSPHTLTLLVLKGTNCCSILTPRSPSPKAGFTVTSSAASASPPVAPLHTFLSGPSSPWQPSVVQVSRSLALVLELRAERQSAAKRRICLSLTTPPSFVSLLNRKTNNNQFFFYSAKPSKQAMKYS